MAVVLLSALGIEAQTNTLSTPDVSMGSGKEIPLPINLDNTSDIVAVQFTIILPDGLTVREDGQCTTTDRTSTHDISFSKKGNGQYTAIILASDNSIIRGRTGSIMTIPILSDENLKEGTALQPIFSDIAIVTRDGSNVATGYSNGTVTIAPSPDLIVKDIYSNVNEITPGENIIINWSVENIGSVATEGGWSEQIALISDDGSDKVLASVYYDFPLSAEGLLSRSTDIKIPDILGINGPARLLVKLIPDIDAGEPSWLDTNNTAVSESLINIKKKLTLSPDSVNVEEKSNVPIRFFLTRSGDVSTAELFKIGKIDDARIIVPSEVVIPKGQSGVYIYMNLIANQLLDEVATHILNISGNDYPCVNSVINIEDDTYPSLNIIFNQEEVIEGENFDLKITVERAPKDDMEIFLTCELPSRFIIPTIILPAGETEITTTLTAKEDEQPDVTQSVQFTAWANGYNKSSDIIELKDNDVPSLQFSLTPNAISEASGPVSIVGKLIRNDNINKSVTIKFSDDSNGNIYYSREVIEMKPGMKELTINLGPIDNTIVDGERTYNISASVWIASCSCNADNGASGGYVSVPLTVYDDDGSTLKMFSSTSVMKEGSEMMVTLSRNTDSTDPLTVNISSDHDTLLKYPSSVTIPAGESKTTFIVKSIRKDIDNEDFMVVLTAETEGFAKGNIWFMVSDQTLPDAQISDIAVSENEIEVGQNITLKLNLVNTGSTVLPEMTQICFYRKGAVKPMAIAYLQSDLLPDESVMIERSITLPDAVGSYSLYAVVNEDQNIKELLYSNNTSSNVDVKVKSPYVFTIKTDKDRYNQNDLIQITGSIEGRDIANKNIDIYIINDGVRQVLKAHTDENGSFALNYEPYTGQMGQFKVGACYPNENLSDSYVSFDIYGLKRTNSQPLYFQTTIGKDINGSITIFNPGSLPVTDLKASIVSAPENCNIQIDCFTELSGGTVGDILFRLTPTALSEGNDWQRLVIGLSSNEGAFMTIPVYYYCYSEEGKIKSSVVSIKTTMVKDGIRDYPFEIANIGKGSTGKITLALPDWIMAATPIEMSSLESGESANVVLRFAPTDEMQLNVPVTGSFGINCENGEGAVVPFSIEPVSDVKGVLAIDVCDEYTYYTAESPRVAGAEIRLFHPTTGELIVSGLTDENGKFSAIVNEGYYALSVTAKNHDGYRNNVLIDPSSEKNLTVNLSIEAITVGWNVEETEVEDEYKIVTTAKFETNVPVPVVELTIPESIPAKDLASGESLIFNAILTNKGLITAQEVEFIAPEGFTYLSFEPLTNTEPFSLAPQQSIIIPVKVTHVKNNSSRVRPIDNDPCVAQPGTLYAWDCGLDRKWHRYSIAMQVGSCNSNDSTTWYNSGNGNYGIHGGGGWRPEPHTGFGGGYYGPSSNNNNVSTREDKGCEPCQNQFMLDLIDCGLQLVPAYKTLKTVVNCATSVINAVKLAHKNPTYAQMYGALLDAVSSCAAAKNAGKGDKNKKRESEREKAIEDIITATGQISGKLLQQEAGWDDTVEFLGSLAQNLLTLKGFDYENIEELFCPLKLFKPCDKEGDTDSIPLRIKSLDKIPALNAEPSYIQEFRKSLAYPLVDQMALLSMMYEFYGDVSWLDADQEQLDKFFDVFYSLQDENECIGEEFYETLIASKPENISKVQVRNLIERWNNSLRGDTQENRIDYEKIFMSVDLFDSVDSAVSKLGYESFSDYFEVEYEKCRKEAENRNNSVCSSITLQFSQSMVMTRQAFRGTLTVFNGNETTSMTDVKLSLTVKDEKGNLATSHEIQINPESISGFEGNLSLSDGWSLDANETGTATILFIPTKYAAPTLEKVYSFGGTLTYLDPFTGLEVSRILSPVFLTVKPSPNLDLTYFVQRDIQGDDPLTEVIEPSEEGEFSVLITNLGYGDATNLKMVTDQPQIIDNKKGLLIDFELISSQLNGGEKTLALGNSVATDFGTIPAKGSAYAQWWMKSSLLGHFTDYNVEATHVTSYDNPDLSLLNKVSIYELIRSVDVGEGMDKSKGFMTNNIKDANDTPDMIYLSNGEIEEVYTASALNLKKVDEDKYILKVTPAHQGWNYGNILDPTYGVSKIMSIVRKSDGKEISLRNIWQTDRTLRDGKDPLYENRIHFADDMLSDAAVDYELTFSPAPMLLLEVAAIEGIPMEGIPAGAPIETLNVMMNKYIDPATFNYEDIEMTVQGSRIDSDGIIITTDDNKTFRLDLSKVDQSEPGYHTITIKTADIVDAEGFVGKNGKTVGWSYYPDGKVSIGIDVYPENSGKVTQLIDGAETPITPSSVLRTPYGESITLAAFPEEGYEFAEWTNLDESYSSKEKIELTAISNSELTAEFTPKSYTVDVDSNCKGGSIYGISTGYYSFGDELSFTAVAEDGFVFKNWIVNGEEAGAELQLTLTVKGETKVSAVFLEGTGVDSLISRRKTVIYSIDGLLINSDATLETIENLEKGVYIINGVKCLIQ